MPTKAPNEMFYLDKDGKKQDADLHASLLDGVDGAPDLVAVRADLLADGWSQEDIDVLWPAPKAANREHPDPS